ncbi:hypothetical protein F383_22340 [Gossypium arboreum]|uniref:Uncharacterized protein n=1 Tax=Gossypium arboreum TaxID=29729 RepID=A0A0B0NXY4_GOSAR|nr:hypothetical protein F383_22340 [Gossypium arboreum]
MSGTCISHIMRANVRHVWDMHRPRDIQAMPPKKLVDHRLTSEKPVTLSFETLGIGGKKAW